MKIKRRGNTLEIKFDSHDESVSFLKRAGFKNLPSGPKFQAVEQADEVDNSRPHNPASWTECEFCGLIHDPKLTRCHLS